jgi:hypothetical protein
VRSINKEGQETRNLLPLSLFSGRRFYGFLRLVGLEAVVPALAPELLELTDAVGLRVVGLVTFGGDRVGVAGRLTVGVVRLLGADVTRRGTDGLIVVGRTLLVDVPDLVTERFAEDGVVRLVDVTCRRASVVRTGFT